MQAAEEFYDGCQSVVDLIIAWALNTLSKFIVSEVSDDARSSGIQIHEILESSVTSLLELNVILERRFEEFINLFLKVEKLLRELSWLLDQLIVINDFLAFLFDVVT